MIQPVNTYAPSMIKSLGFSGLQANGMNSVGSVGSLVLSISLAYSSDRFRERGLHIAVGFLWGAAGLLWLALAHDGVSKWVLYGKLHDTCFLTFDLRFAMARTKANVEIRRRRRNDANGHGQRPSHQCRVAGF